MMLIIKKVTAGGVAQHTTDSKVVHRKDHTQAVSAARGVSAMRMARFSVKVSVPEGP